jgi:hypothetical protein
VPRLRIVPQELRGAVKARQCAMTRKTRPYQRRPRYLRSGIMKCVACGASHTKYGQNRFACAALRDRGTCTNKLMVRGDSVETAISSPG